MEWVSFLWRVRSVIQTYEAAVSVTTRLHQLSGKDCCGFGSDPEFPDVISLDFGERTTGVEGLTGSETEIVQSCGSDFRLTLYCAWRVLIEGSIAFGWRDASLDEFGASTELAKLIGKQVQVVDVNPTTYDLRVCFQGDTELEAYCDVTNNCDFDQNYVLTGSKWICTVGLKSLVLIEKKRRS